jgi:hypothetical protein
MLRTVLFVQLLFSETCGQNPPQSPFLKGGGIKFDL